MISVIVPTYNRASVLKTCLQRLAAQQGAEFEVIVVDDGSTDDTKGIVRNFQASSPNFQINSKAQIPTWTRLCYTYQSNARQAAARNRGVQEAQGDIVVFIGDDSFVEPGWLSAHAQFHKQHPEKEAMAVGHITWTPELANDRFSRWLESTGLMPNYKGLADGDRLDYWRFYTGNISLKRSWFQTHRFDEAFRAYGYEDTLLGVQLIESGARLFYASQAKVLHQHPLAPSDYFPHRMRQIGQSAVLLHRRCPRIPVLPSGFKRFAFSILAWPWVGSLLGLLKKEWGWYALSKRGFMQGVQDSLAQGILIAGSYGASNLGDEAMLKILLQRLPQGSGRFVLSGRPADTWIRHAGWDEIGPHLPFGLRSFFSPAWLKSLRLIRQSRLVLLGGGGLFVDDYSAKAVPLWAWHIFCFRLLGRPVILFANSIGPLRTPMGRFLAARALRRCQKIMVRDADSLRLAQNLAPEIPAFLGADLAFLHEPSVPAPLPKRIALNLRPWQMELDPVRRWVQAKAAQGYEFWLLPMEPSDERLLEELGLPGARLLRPADFSEACALLSQCELALGMRLHFLIGAILSGCRVAGIAYSRKVQSVLEEFSLPSLAPAGLGEEALEALLQQAHPASAASVQAARRRAEAMLDLALPPA